MYSITLDILYSDTSRIVPLLIQTKHIVLLTTCMRILFSIVKKALKKRKITQKQTGHTLILYQQSLIKGTLEISNTMNEIRTNHAVKRGAL